MFRPLRTTSPLAKLIASLGILLTLQATVLLWFGPAVKQVPNILTTNTIEVFGVPIPVNRFWMTGIVVVIALVLVALYRWTRFGLATRAASENEVFGMLAGLSPNQLSMSNTVYRPRLWGSWGSSPRPAGAGRFDDPDVVRRSRVGGRCSPASRRSARPASPASSSASGSR